MGAGERIDGFGRPLVFLFVGLSYHPVTCVRPPASDTKRQAHILTAAGSPTSAATSENYYKVKHTKNQRERWKQKAARGSPESREGGHLLEGLAAQPRG